MCSVYSTGVLWSSFRRGFRAWDWSRPSPADTLSLGMTIEATSGPAGKRWKLPLLIAGAVFVAFLPVLWSGFTNWDDDANFTENPAYRGLGPDQLRWMFTNF